MRPLERIAAQANKYLDNLARIERMTSTQDAMGAVVNEWALVNDAIMCRLIRGTDGRTGDMATVGNQQKLTESYRVVFLAGTNIRAGDRIIIDGIAYQVVGLNRVSTVYMNAVVTT